jgi:hypothetical protein
MRRKQKEEELAKKREVQTQALEPEPAAEPAQEPAAEPAQEPAPEPAPIEIESTVSE